MQFPPDSAKPRLDAIRKARAWWSGERLVEDSGAHFWAVADARSRTGWGPTTIRKQHRIHVPVAGDLALVSADHLFGGGLELPEDERVVELSERVGLATLAPVAAERCSGMGEVYLRWGWRDLTVPLLDIIDPDRVVPTFSWGRLVAADVGEDLAGWRGAKWVHVEHHEPGLITHRLYRRAVASLAGPLSPEPLSAHPETAKLAAEVRLPSALANRLALVYVPNARPKGNRPGGASDTEGSETLMAGVDEAISSLQRDIRLGKARLVVSEWLLDRTRPLDGAFFDLDGEIYAPVAGGGDDSTKSDITPYQPDLRVNQHLDAARDYVQRIVSSAGYSPESLISNRAQLPESGTARRLREAASIRTTQRKVAIWRPALSEVLSSLMVVAYGLDTPPLVAVGVHSAYAPDVAETASVVATLAVAAAASTQTKVRLVHPTWDDALVAAEVARILEERRASDTPDDVVPS